MQIYDALAHQNHIYEGGSRKRSSRSDELPCSGVSRRFVGKTRTVPTSLGGGFHAAYFSLHSQFPIPNRA